MKLRYVVVAALGVALLAGCLKPEDASAQNDLRAALAAENQVRADTGQYTDNLAALKALAPSLDWGGKLLMVVGDARDVGDEAAVCLQEQSPTGTTWAIAQVAIGADAGVYTSTVACPAVLSGPALAWMGTQWTP